jgi:hypothetical protein
MGQDNILYEKLLKDQLNLHIAQFGSERKRKGATDAILAINHKENLLTATIDLSKAYNRRQNKTVAQKAHKMDTGRHTRS